MSRSYTAFCPKSETIHLTVHDIATSGNKLPTVRAICGRSLKVTGVYASREAVIERFAEEHQRLSLTHETGLCRNCFDRYAEAKGGSKLSTEMKTARQVAIEVADTTRFRPVTHADVVALATRAIEADRAQRTPPAAEPIQEPATEAVANISEFAGRLAATLDRDQAIVSLDAMPASAKGSSIHAALVRRIESFGSAV